VTTPEAKHVMARLTSEELRKLADQVDAYTALEREEPTIRRLTRS